MVAGAISGFAKVQPQISGTLAGTAIAVALVPPICVIGLGLAQTDWSLSIGAALLYLTNLLGILLACMLTFLVAGYTPLKRGRAALLWTLALTGLIIVPLSFSFEQLIMQSRLEAILRYTLGETLTFRQVELTNLNTDWLTKPPQVRLSIQSQKDLTPKQVRLLEEFVAKKMGQRFTFIFEVTPVKEVKG